MDGGILRRGIKPWLLLKVLTMNPMELTVVLFPLLVPIWDKGPIDSQNSKSPEKPSFLAAEAVQAQRKFYQEAQDPRLRDGVASTLSQANNAEAVKALERLLRKRGEPYAQSELLAALDQYQGKATVGAPEGLAKHFESSSPYARAHALSLYLAKTGDAATVVARLKGERSEYVINFLRARLSAYPDALPAEGLAAAAGSRCPALRLAGIYLLALSCPKPNQAPELKDAARSPSAAVRLELARGLGERRSGGVNLLKILAKDSNASVRGLVASAAKEPKLETVAEQLAADPDAEVRRLACVTLGSHRTDASIAALLPRLADSERKVRDAAELALAALRPGPEVVARLEGLLTEAPSRDSAIRVLSLLGATGSSDQILAALKAADKHETRARAIHALGELGNHAAAAEIASKAKSPDPATRRAVAFALGVLAEPDTFAALETLISDKDIAVTLEAIKSAGLTKSDFFSERLYKVIMNTSPSGNADARAAACWAIARIGGAKPKVVERLNELCLKQVVEMEMEKTHDADYVRASACLALADLGRADAAAKETAETIMGKWRETPIFATDVISDELKDFNRQIELHLAGKTAEPCRIEPVEPRYAVSPEP